MKKFIDILKTLIPFTTILALLYWLSGFAITLPINSDIIFKVSIVLGLVPLAVDILGSIINKRFGVDLIAIVSITGSLLLGEYLAGAVILLMLSGGEYLEGYALRRSKKELHNLLSLAPRFAHIRKDGEILKIDIDKVKIDDEIIVKPGELVPVDGIILEGISSFDESTITGEAIPVEKTVHDWVYSGVVNKESAVVVKVMKTSVNSKYQQIVKLVEEAEKDRAPFVRLADRYSVWFTILTFALAGVSWLISNDPIRALTVLVVATPCPLILATPIAFASGVSKGAGRGVIIKSGATIEQLARSKTFVFDKTGTLTEGRPQIVNLEKFSEKYQTDDLVKISASLEQFSEHVLSKGFLDYAKSKKIHLINPTGLKESFGNGIKGEINGVSYKLGKLNYVLNGFEPKYIEKFKELNSVDTTEGKILVFLGNVNNQEIIASFLLSDKPRKDIVKEIQLLKNLGVRKFVMLTGDKESIAKEYSEKFSISEYIAEISPEEKMIKIEEIKKNSKHPVVMIGDGINDSPALAKADIGIAFGVLGTNATTDAGDIVITSGNFDRVSYTYSLSKKVLEIAKQGIFIGMGLSTILMFFGAFGLFVPAIGALLQEVIDFIVIINSLRVKVRLK
jgi:heavy metal translocating P-type ATPase